ncbi:MAG: HEPN domain-containing protein [Anaerolineae bacterium]
MIDIDRQMTYWRDSALEDWEVAQELVNSGRTRHGLFFAHLALEKTLKAHVCQQTQDLPPKIHSVLLLAQKATLPLAGTQKAFLGRFDRYQLEGRYPDISPAKPGMAKAKQEMALAEDFLQWLHKQF